MVRPQSYSHFTCDLIVILHTVWTNTDTPSEIPNTPTHTSARAKSTLTRRHTLISHSHTCCEMTTSVLQQSLSTGPWGKFHVPDFKWFTSQHRTLPQGRNTSWTRPDHHRVSFKIQHNVFRRCEETGGTQEEHSKVHTDLSLGLKCISKTWSQLLT